MEDTLGNTIRNARINAGLTRIQLSNLTGLNCRAIERIEKGKTENPYISTLHSLAITLNLEYPALLQFTRHKMNEPKEDFASILQTARKNAGLSLLKLADLANLSSLTIQKIEERKTKKIRISTLEQLSNALNLDLPKMKKFCGY